MSRRTERLGEEIREEVAVIVGRQLKDPGIGFVTVTRVSVTPDLRYAQVCVSVLGSESERKKSLTGLKRAAGYIRRELGRRLRLRHTPELHFEYDVGIEATERVAELLTDIGPISEADDEPEEE